MLGTTGAACCFSLCSSRPRTQVAELLLAAGADPAVVDHDGWTALDHFVHFDREEMQNLLASNVARQGAGEVLA